MKNVSARQERLAVNKLERQLNLEKKAAKEAAEAAAMRAADIQKESEKVGGLSASEAREKLSEALREEALAAISDDLRRAEASAKQDAELRSQTIVAAAVQRYASEYVTERTVATVPLPSDDMKGRIIGREGRNVRAIEAATGVDLIIDDTPEAVVISCFNPVRREIAKVALTRLIADGRIHPSRIEETVEKAKSEVDQVCKDAGEQAVFDLGLARMHPELVNLVGSLKFRSANGQNLLQHSVEVGWRGPWRPSWGCPSRMRGGPGCCTI